MEISAILLFALIPAPGQPTSALGLAEAITKVAAVVTLIMLFGKYAVNKLFAAAENNLTGRETTFSLVVGIVLGFGFLAQYVGFNSAIAAFFLGVFESDHVNSNAYLQHVSKKAPTFREEMNCQRKSLSAPAKLCKR